MNGRQVLDVDRGKEKRWKEKRAQHSVTVGFFPAEVGLVEIDELRDWRSADAEMHSGTYNVKYTYNVSSTRSTLSIWPPTDHSDTPHNYGAGFGLQTAALGTSNCCCFTLEWSGFQTPMWRKDLFRLLFVQKLRAQPRYSRVGWVAGEYLYLYHLSHLPTPFSLPFSHPSPHPIFQREVLSRGLGVRWGTTRRRLGSSGDILLSGATALCGTMPCPGSGFAYCVGDAKLENDRVGDVSKPVSGKAMCRALRYVSAFLKLDRSRGPTTSRGLRAIIVTLLTVYPTILYVRYTVPKCPGGTL
ncbi:hypothetical protein B0H13DRAFT_1923424 [Mycena leptocephala]|nr:hypothetical protein B0H13DRAFT_1923424 [Mycena leptocephala]